MCTAYGDRHYRTFDGLLYDYIGACKVYLIKVLDVLLYYEKGQMVPLQSMSFFFHLFIYSLSFELLNIRLGLALAVFFLTCFLSPTEQCGCDV